jgi:hypothetical protein
VSFESDEIMSFADIPAETEAKQILNALNVLNTSLQDLNTRLDNQAAGLNSLGENVMWIVDNVKGIFAMFNSPAMMAQIGSFMGGIPNGGPNADPTA